MTTAACTLNSSSGIRRSLALAIALAFTGLAQAAEAPKPPEPQSWLGDVTLSGKAFFDSNVYATDNERPGYALANQEAWAFTTSLKVATFPLVGLGGSKSDLSLTYALTDTRYKGLAIEDNTVHKVLASSTHKAGALSWSAEGSLAYIDGSKETSRYFCYSAFAIAVPRERRNQWQEALKGSLKYEKGDYFLRAVGAFQSFDLLTTHHNPTGTWTGWLNYIDRYDLNGGLDLGRKSAKSPAVFLAWRTGYQHQQATSWQPAAASNHYQRVLLGFDGKLGEKFTATLLVGPDFRRFNDKRSSTDLNSTAVYAEGQLAYAATKNDSVAGTFKQWRWVSSTGKSVYDDKSVQTTWKHTLNKAWSTSLLAQLQQSDYVAPGVRKENQYSFGAGVTWKTSPKTSLSFDYTHSRIENLIAGSVADGREMERDVVGLTAAHTF